MAQSKLSVIPIDWKSKKPLGPWKPQQAIRSEPDAVAKQVEACGAMAIAVVCGAVSGGLLVIDFDVDRFFAPWLMLVGEAARGLPIVRTKSGYHVYLRCGDPGGNARWAWAQGTGKSLAREIAIETRGEGGYVIAPPSRHAQGGHYYCEAGDLTAIPFVSPERLGMLRRAAIELCEVPFGAEQINGALSAHVHQRVNKSYTGEVIGPFNAASDVRNILERNQYNFGRAGTFRRPGKNHGSSGIIRYGRKPGGQSVHFSTNDPLNDGNFGGGICGVHDAFDLYRLLEHGGSWDNAVRGAARLLTAHSPTTDLHSLNNGVTYGDGKDRRLGEAQTDRIAIQDLTAADLTEVTTDQIEIDTQNPKQHLTVDAAITALGQDPQLYSRSGVLCRLLDSGEHFDVIPSVNLMDRLSRVATFVGRNRSRVPPPSLLAAQVLARGSWHGIREVRTISKCPILRLDGSLHVDGYDPITQVIANAGNLNIDIPAAPSREAASEAGRLLLEIISDFPMASDSHRSVWLACVLTMVCKHAFTGQCPGFMFEAPRQGSGKGLAAEVAHIIAFGSPPKWSQYSACKDEMAKSILSSAIQGQPVLAFDNIEGRFGDPALSTAITSGWIQGRLLGVNKHWAGPFSPVYLFTANNVQLQADFPRRLLSCRIVPDVEDPENRSGFKQPDLRTYVCGRRAQFISAAMTVVRGFIRSNRPPCGLSPIGSFEGWSTTIRNALVWAGFADPAGHRQAFAANADDDGERLKTLMRSWSLFCSDGDDDFVAADLIERLYAKNDDRQVSKSELEARTALEFFVQPRGPRISVRELGYALRKVSDRIAIGKRIVSKHSNRGARWRLESVREVSL